MNLPPSPGQNGETPLHLAAHQGQNAAIKALVAAGAHVQAKDKVKTDGSIGRIGRRKGRGRAGRMGRRKQGWGYVCSLTRPRPGQLPLGHFFWHHRINRRKEEGGGVGNPHFGGLPLTL